MTVPPEILFVHNHPTRFVEIDRQLLAEQFTIREWYQRGRVVNLPALASAVRRSQLVFGWFASWHTFFPVLLAQWWRKPSVIVIGGYDTASLPNIGYGHQRGGLKKWVSRWIINRASLLITHSYFSQTEIKQNFGLPLERIQVAYLGLPDPFGLLPEKPPAPLILTVGNVDRPNLWRKGLMPFVQAAACVPDCQFVVVGAWKDEAINDLRAIATPNVTFTGRVSETELLDYFRAASVYVQASAHEGFGLSVAEAMLAGCIPVVTRAGSLPEVVGEVGIYVSLNSAEAVAEGVRQALALGGEVRQQARDRILARFPLENRKHALWGFIESLLL